MMWDENTSKQWIRYGGYFVPQRDFQMDTIAGLIPDPGEPFNVLDLCCGDGLLAGRLLEKFPSCTVYGMDGSAEMLSAASERLQSYGGRFKPVLFDLASSAWRKPAFPVQAVVSSMAVHHLDDEEKDRLFRDIYCILSPGGVLLISDIFLPAGEMGIRYAAAALDETVRKRAMQLDGNLATFELFKKRHWNIFQYPEDPMDRPSSLLAQLHALKLAGFRRIDVFWMLAGHVIFGGVKPAVQG